MGATTTPEIRRKSLLSVNIPMRRLITPELDAEVKASPESDDGQPLSPASRFFQQPKFNCHIITILGFGKIIGTFELKAGLEATLVRHPRFSSVQVTQKSGHDKWVPIKVNLDDHVFFPHVSAFADTANEDYAAGDRYVEDYAAALSQTHLDPSRPMWDIHFLAIRTSEAVGTAIFRIHHSLGDGISLMSLFLACTCKTSDFESLPALPEARRRRPTSAAGTGPWKPLYWVCNFLVCAYNTLVDAFLFVASASFLKDTKTPIMGSEGVEFRPKRFAHRTLSLDDIKGIKSAMGCTVNDVLLGVTSAALSRYLSRCYDGHLPQNLRIRTTMLVNIRPMPGINALADMMRKGSEGKWGNHLGYNLLRFPVMKCEDPLDYIRNGKAVADKKKKSWEAIFTFTSAFLLYKSLGIKNAAALFHRIMSNTTLSFSNIVGPMEEIGFCGSPLVFIAPSVYGHPHALTIHFQSYLNKMKVVVAVDELVIPDPHMLLDDVAHSLQLIKGSLP